MKREEFIAKAMEIKAKISVNKSNTNRFAGYQYRTIEDILAVAKPVLVGTGIELRTDVDITPLGERLLVTAYATLTDGENVETTRGIAFYDDKHKGMSDEQKLGSATTYALRYALTNLLLAGSGEVDLDSLPPTDYKGQQGQQRPAQAPRQQYQQPAQRQQAAAPARQQVTAPTAPVQRPAQAPQQTAPQSTGQQASAPAPARQQAPATTPAAQSTGQQTTATASQSSGRIPMHEIKPGYDLAGNVKDIYEIRPGREPVYGPYSPQACIFRYDDKGRALRPKACIITREEDEDS